MSDMDKIFIVYYRVRCSRETNQDTAIIIAKNKNHVKRKLKDFINHKANNIVLTNIISIEEYRGTIFTNKFGYEPNKKE